MFDEALPRPSWSQYATLGVGPEVTVEELREATRERIALLNARKKAIEAELEAVYTSVPGLKEAVAAAKQSPGAGERPASGGRAGTPSLAVLEQRAGGVNPNYRTLSDELRSLEDQVNQINNLGLENPTKRLAYDRANPPFELMKLTPCDRDDLTDPATVFALLRRELAAFLTAQGEEVFHPTDTTRLDFRGDFTPNPLLDGPPT